MPGLNAQQLTPRVRSANQVVILIGDQTVAFAQTVTHSFEFGTEAFYGIGTAKPQEIQQLRNGPTITVDNFALSAFGAQLLEGGANLPSLLANNQFSLCVYDGINNAAIYTYVGCVSSNFSETVGANRPVTDAYTFLAMDVLGANGQSLLNGPNALTVAAQVGTTAGANLGITLTG